MDGVSIQVRKMVPNDGVLLCSDRKEKGCINGKRHSHINRDDFTLKKKEKKEMD
jgi:hypothetical protein